MATVAEFYSDTPIADLKQVIGEDLHYHFGFFRTPDEPFEEALRNAVRNFYRWIPRGATVLDLGAGWGGPAALLRHELEARPYCITNSSQQADYIASRGLPGELADLEGGVSRWSDTSWDVVLMMESLEHIRDKLHLLAAMPMFARCLVLRVNCSAFYSEGGVRQSYAGSMVMPRPEELLSMLKTAGWKVSFYANRRRASLPTFARWREGLIQRYDDNLADAPGHMKALGALCDEVARGPEAWISQNPLVDVVAFPDSTQRTKS